MSTPELIDIVSIERHVIEVDVVELGSTAGPPGPAGPQGDAGPTGAQGPQGEQGEQGPTGPAGPQGEQGNPGPTGPQGEQGSTGATGDAGPAGSKGDAGVPGPKGDPGTDGATGPAGPAGPTGADGPQGIPGNDGQDGAPGTPGAQGPQGPQGPQGLKGDPGATGATGSQGPQGNVGPQGPKGDTGAQGSQGVQGPQGDTGPQGPQGAQGVPGTPADTASLVKKAGDIMTGALTTKSGAGVGVAQSALSAVCSDGHGLLVVPSDAAGGFNGMAAAGDLLLTTTGSADTQGIAIAPWSATLYGIRMSGAAVMVNCNSTASRYNGATNSPGWHWETGGAGVSQSNNNANFWMSKASGWSNGAFINLQVAGSTVGSITTNGSSVAFNTTSDYRLKENVTDLTDGLERILQCRPVAFTWKTTGAAARGFIAHELQAVEPDAVSGQKDGTMVDPMNPDGPPIPDYQGVDGSLLIPDLVAAIQVLTARIAVLEQSRPG